MIFASIAENEQEAKALKRAIRFSVLFNPRIDSERCNCEYRSLVIPRKAAEEALSTFKTIEASVAEWVAKDDVTVLVSQANPMQLNPLLRQGIESLIAMVILSFPEVRWFFGTIKGYGKPDSDIGGLEQFRSANGLHNLTKPDQSSLFDGMGLRDWVRRLAVEHNETKYDACYLPRREQFAIALDEETDYAHLHAYTAYRFGFRALEISEMSAADAVLGLNAASTWATPEIILEDLFLNFPDGARGLSDLRERYEAFPILEDVTHRILVTSGQRVVGDAGKEARNKQYVSEKCAQGKHIQFLYKPHAGIFSVWEQSGLDRKLRWQEENGKLNRGTGEDYIWPPDWSKMEQKHRGYGHVEGSGHSTPGIFLLIARHLLNRAESMLANNLSSVEEAVHGAVLANEALELLGGKTPTTAAEALSLKHQFELHAECQFTGVEHHIPLHHRFKEIKRDAESIACWFLPRERHRAALNIQMSIANNLVSILRQYNQFDEEQEYLNHVRHVHNSLYMHERPWRYVFWPVLRYFEFLLSSFPKFTLAIFLWIVGLTLLFDVSSATPDATSAINNFSSFGHAIGSFFGVEPYPWSIGLSVFSIVAGLAHLGIFISHLYVLVSKR